MMAFSFLCLYLIRITCRAKINTLFGATPIQFFNETFNNWSVIGYANNTSIKDDIDIISIHEDAVYGVPYTAFWNLNGTINESLFPIPWVQHLQQTAYQIKNIYGNKPIFLSLPLSDGSHRSCPAQNVTHNNGQQPFNNCSQCYNYNITTNPEALSVMNAFKQYTMFMIYYFSTYQNITITHINHAVEINEYITNNATVCPIQYWYSLIEYVNSVYDMIKLQYPKIKVFPSFVGSQFLGFGGTDCAQNNTKPCIIREFERIKLLKYDIFALSSYPWANQIRNYSEIVYTNSNYLNQIFDVLLNNKTLNTNNITNVGIAETGYPTTDVIVEEIKHDSENVTCFKLIHSNISMAMDWLNYIGLDIQNKYNLEIFIWWSDANIEPVHLLHNVNVIYLIMKMNIFVNWKNYFVWVNQYF
eukprot:522300_1